MNPITPRDLRIAVVTAVIITAMATLALLDRCSRSETLPPETEPRLSVSR